MCFSKSVCLQMSSQLESERFARKVTKRFLGFRNFRVRIQRSGLQTLVPGEEPQLTILTEHLESETLRVLSGIPRISRFSESRRKTPQFEIRKKHNQNSIYSIRFFFLLILQLAVFFFRLIERLGLEIFSLEFAFD